jgi:hypothetical protein
MTNTLIGNLLRHFLHRRELSVIDASFPFTTHSPLPSTIVTARRFAPGSI